MADNQAPVPQLPGQLPALIATIMALFSSRKAVVATLVVIGAFAAMLTKRADTAQMVDLIKWVTASWLGAQATEDVAKQLSNKPSA